MMRNRTLLAFLAAPALCFATPPAFDVQTTSKSVVINNLTSDQYMEMLIKIGTCENRVMAGPGGVVTMTFRNGKHPVDVKSVTLTPVRELVARERQNPQPLPQPVSDPKILASMKPVCAEIE